MHLVLNEINAITHFYAVLEVFGLGVLGDLLFAVLIPEVASQRRVPERCGLTGAVRSIEPTRLSSYLHLVRNNTKEMTIVIDSPASAQYFV